jgi:hypothetical protein
VGSTSNVLAQTVSYTLSASVDSQAILAAAGFEIRRNRATCPTCHEGHKPPDLTVAIHGNLYFCHRCHRGGHIHQLARAQGIKLSPRRQALADLRKMYFRQWLSKTMAELSKEEHRLHKKARLAVAALSFPELADFEPAWEALRRLHERERVFEHFWSLATNRIGRYRLYKGWRKKHGLNRPKT